MGPINENVLAQILTMATHVDCVGGENKFLLKKFKKVKLKNINVW